MNIFHVKPFLFHSTSSSQGKIFDLLCVCKKISLSVYLRIFNALIASIFPNNSEPWALTKKEAQKIDTFQRKTENWTIKIQERRLRWFGHLQRHPKEAPERKAYEEATQRPVKNYEEVSQ